MVLGAPSSIILCSIHEEKGGTQEKKRKAASKISRIDQVGQNMFDILFIEGSKMEL